MAYGLTFRLELEDGTLRDPPTFRSAPGVSWEPGVSRMCPNSSRAAPQFPLASRRAVDVNLDSRRGEVRRW
jgi:hypothetical protein